jgi:DNA-binding transcriptional LysR family regulator
MIVASPFYLARRGMPERAEDLVGHACLGFNFRHHVPVWPLRQGGQVIEHRLDAALLANNGETVRRMALAGLGLARMGEFHIREDLRTGALVEVLAEATAGDSEDVHALFLGTEHMPQRVRAFLDFMAPNLRAFLQAAPRGAA